jgi:uncharacterized protein (TIGR03435 family)
MPILQKQETPRVIPAGLLLSLLLAAGGPLLQAAAADPAFAVTSIRPSAAPVPFEHDGRTETSPGALSMRDVSVITCIKWAYGVGEAQVAGPAWLQSERYDILAKADGPVGDEQLKLMLRTLLAERFKLAFQRETRELRGYALTVAKGAHKLHEAENAGNPFRQNSATGMIARSMTMSEFADFIAGPLQTPVVDKTGLKGRYDFAIDFTAYLPTDGTRPDTIGIIMAALQGELGLKLESQKMSTEVLVINHAEKPSAN